MEGKMLERAIIESIDPQKKKSSKTYIHRADFEIKKLDINGESTVEGGIHMPHTIISCTQQFFINCTTIQSTSAYIKKKLHSGLTIFP